MPRKNVNRNKRIYLEIYDEHFVFGEVYHTKDEVLPYYKTHTDKECARHFGVCLSNFKKIVMRWNLKKTSTEIASLQKAIKQERYGDPNYNNREKREATLITQYGSLDEAYKDQVRMCRESKQKKYGDPNYNNPLKNKETCLQRYGVDNVFKSDEIKQKIHDTALERYGVDWTSQSKITLEHAKQTFQVKYGSDNYLSSKEFKQFKKENKEYLKNIRVQTQERILKDNPKFYYDLAKIGCETKRKNGTFNKSKPEESWYTVLCNKYGEDNITRQYVDDRYPFNCDFYVKTLDLFIEINDFWTHGKHPFNENDENDLKELDKIRCRQKLNAKGKKNSYYTAEDVWTKRDPMKLQTAIDNDLQYIMVYGNKIYDKNKQEVELPSINKTPY